MYFCLLKQLGLVMPLWLCLMDEGFVKRNLCVVNIWKINFKLFEWALFYSFVLFREFFLNKYVKILFIKELKK